MGLRLKKVTVERFKKSLDKNVNVYMIYKSTSSRDERAIHRRKTVDGIKF